MEKKQYSYAERFGLWLRGLYLENRVPFLAALLTGLAAHMFMSVSYTHLTLPTICSV